MAARICTFTAAQGTTLETYTLGDEPRFTKQASLSSSSAQITSAGRVRCDTTSGSPSEFLDDSVFASADYSVALTVRVLSAPPAGYIGVLGRYDSLTSPLFAARYNFGTGNWELYRLGQPGVSSLGTPYAQALSLNTNYIVTLDMVGTTIRLLVDGVERISVTDASTATAGQAGLIFQCGFAGSDTTFAHGDTYTVTGTFGNTALLLRRRRMVIA